MTAWRRSVSSARCWSPGDSARSHGCGTDRSPASIHRRRPSTRRVLTAGREGYWKRWPSPCSRSLAGTDGRALQVVLPSPIVGGVDGWLFLAPNWADTDRGTFESMQRLLEG